MNQPCDRCGEPAVDLPLLLPAARCQSCLFELHSELHSWRLVQRKSSGTVYFCARADQLIKIGVSHDIPNRLRQLAREFGPIKLLAEEPGGQPHEQEIHRHFSHLRVEREWFRSDDELLAYIALARDPDPIDAPFKLRAAACTFVYGTLYDTDEVAA